MRTILLLLCAVAAFGQIKSGSVTSGSITSAVAPNGHTNYDSFNRANENPIASGMSDGIGTWTSGPGAMADMQINSIVLKGTTAGENGIRVLSPAYSPRQQCGITLTTANGLGVMVRMPSATLASGYLLTVTDTTHLQINVIRDTGTISYTLIASFTVGSVGFGSQMSLKATGNLLTAYLDGVSVGTVTDATYPTGNPGLYVVGTTDSGLDFTASDFP